MNEISSGRRALLRQTITLAAFAYVSSCRPLFGAPGTGSHTVVATLQDSVADLDAAARIGAVYLDTHPQDRDVERLLAAIEKAVRAHATAMTNPQDGMSIEHLVVAIQADYVDDATVWVGDWILSRTEARLFALIALLQKKAG